MGMFVTLWHEDRSPCILNVSRIKEVKEYTSSLTKIVYGDDNREIIVLGSKVSVVTKIKFIDGSTMEVQGKKEKLIDVIRFAEVTD